MRKELEQKLARRSPNCFGLAGNPRLSPIPLGFQRGDGWYNIRSRLCADLEPLVAELEKKTGGRFDVVQVEQKLGALRSYVSHHTDPIDERIAEAQRKSAHAHGVMS